MDIFRADLSRVIESAVPHGAYQEIIAPLGTLPSDVVAIALNAAKEFKRPIVTEIKQLEKFYEAEDYHKNYYANNMDKPFCQLIISPKLTHLRQEYSTKIK